MTQSTHTVLLVDDQAPILRALRLTIKERSLRVLTTTDPLEALDILATESVDVLISDVDMPVMSGTELCARVRAEYPHVVRMMLTSSDSLHAAITAINEGGVFRYLTKPWKAADVKTALSAAIAHCEEARRSVVDRETRAHRDEILGALERSYPGITRDPRRESVYEISAARAAEVAERLDALGLSSLLP